MKTAYAIVDGVYKNAFGQSFDTLEKLTEATEAIEARRQKLAAKDLSAKELVNGVTRGPLPVRERLAHDQWRPITGDEAPAPSNPFRKDLENLERERKYEGMSIRERLTREAADRWDSDKAQAEREAQRQAEFAADTRRQRALALAQSQYEWALFAPEATAGDVAHAERTLRQLQEGLLQPGLDQLEQGRQRIEQAATDRAAELQRAIEHVRQSYQTTVDDPAPAAPTFYPRDYVGNVSPEERERSNRAYSEWMRENKRGVYAS